MATKDIGNLRTRLSWEDEGANRSLEGFRRDLKGLRSEMSLARSGGQKYTKSLKGMREQSDILTRRFQTQEERVRELKRRYDESVRVKGEDANQTRDLAAQYNNATAEMNRTEQQLERLNKEIKRQESPWTKLGTQLDKTGEKMQKIGKSMTDFGKSYSLRVTAPIVAGGVAVFKASMDYESAFAGVRKTVDATEEEFKMLSDGIREMTGVLPASAVEIAAVGEAAGQLGIETENILSFTRTMIDLGEATNMTADTAATQFARFANIVGMSQKDFDRLGSVVVDLGNNLATTEAEIVNMAMRLAGAGAQIGLTEAEIMAFSGALSSVGIAAEAGGSAFSKVMINMQLAAETGSKDLESFAKVSNMTASEFKKAFEKDAAGALIAFIDGLANAEEKGMSAIAMLDDMEISEVRMRDALLRAAGASDVFKDSIELGSKAWKENTALTEEAEQRYGTTESQLKMMWNRIKDVSITLGDALVPAVMSALDAAAPLIEKIESGAQAFADMDEEQQQTILKMIALAAAIGPLSMGIGGITTVAGGASRGIGQLATSIGTKTAGKGLVGGMGALVGSGGTLALTAVGIAGVTWAGYELYKHLSSELIPEVDLFGDEVSDTTKKSISSFMDLNNDATVQLNELSWSGREISEEMAESLVSTFNDMSDQVIEALKRQKEESLQSLQVLFDNSKDMTEEERHEMEKMVEESYDKQIETIREGNARIEEIKRTALKEERDITQAEFAEMNKIREDMQEIAIRAMSETEEEMLSIQERLAEQSEIITKREASETIKLAIERRDALIEEAEKLYHDQMSAWETLRENATDEQKKMIDEQIAEAERQRDETTAKANEMYKNVLEVAEENNPKIFNEVSRSTGEILGAWDKLSRDITLSNYNTYLDTEGIWKDIRDIFSGNKIDFVKPNIRSWYELEGNAKSIWDRVKGIFQRNISMPSPTMRQTNVQPKSSQIARFGYADGTDFHPGGNFIAGEEGWELGRMGNSWEMLNLGLYNRPAGYEVFTHNESKSILRALNNIPGYATGARPSNEASRVVSQLNQPQTSQPLILELHLTSEIDGMVAGQAVERYVTEIQERNQRVVADFA